MQQRLNLASDCLGQDRRGAIRGDADHDGRAVDHRTELKIAVIGLVDHIDRNACSTGCDGESLSLIVILKIRDGESGIGKDFG
jgi:hypothetical protein